MNLNPRTVISVLFAVCVLTTGCMNTQPKLMATKTPTISTTTSLQSPMNEVTETPEMLALTSTSLLDPVIADDACFIPHESFKSIKASSLETFVEEKWQKSISESSTENSQVQKFRWVVDRKGYGVFYWNEILTVTSYTTEIESTLDQLLSEFGIPEYVAAIPDIYAEEAKGKILYDLYLLYPAIGVTITGEVDDPAYQIETDGETMMSLSLISTMPMHITVYCSMPYKDAEDFYNNVDYVIRNTYMRWTHADVDRYYQSVSPLFVDWPGIDEQWVAYPPLE